MHPHSTPDIIRLSDLSLFTGLAAAYLSSWIGKVQGAIPGDGKGYGGLGIPYVEIFCFLKVLKCKNLKCEFENPKQAKFSYSITNLDPTCVERTLLH